MQPNPANLDAGLWAGLARLSFVWEESAVVHPAAVWPCGLRQACTLLMMVGTPRRRVLILLGVSHGRMKFRRGTCPLRRRYGCFCHPRTFCQHLALLPRRRAEHAVATKHPALVAKLTLAPEPPLVCIGRHCCCNVSIAIGERETDRRRIFSSVSIS